MNGQDGITADCRIVWGVKVPMKDGVLLDATLYLPTGSPRPVPVVLTLTPYIAQSYHEVGVYFARNAFGFLAVDVRGRGNSEGTFEPFTNEGADGFDAIEWLADQWFCNGNVAMWGGSYGGWAQWMSAKARPPHLVCIAPVASPYLGHDFPFRTNILWAYSIRWLTLIRGRASQEAMFANAEGLWNETFRLWSESGESFRLLAERAGNPNPMFQKWLEHPIQDKYWDSLNPADDDYDNVCLPVLSITGIYDVDQLGALMHYRKHTTKNYAEPRPPHFLVIGPWDHAGTRVPKARFGGISCGPASLIDLRQLHVDWYAWAMRAGPLPSFLKNKVAYYVLGAEQWRYADSLDAVTTSVQAHYLSAVENPSDVFCSGALVPERIRGEPSSYYSYDPRDRSLARVQSEIGPDDLTDQRLIYSGTGRHLIFHSAAFTRDAEVSGFFRLVAWISIDQPDTDFRASVYCISADGRSVLLSSDMLRARHRCGSRRVTFVENKDPMRYEFASFPFTSRLITAGERLRLVLGPINSIYWEKNYNSGGVVADESLLDARPVTVCVFHNEEHPSVLYVPYATAVAPVQVRSS